MAELPFMVTEEILMAAVRAGGDRQELHERIRQHSQEAARQVKQHGRPNDLIDRLQADPAFSGLNFAQIISPSAYVGRAPEQCEQFVDRIVGPVRCKYSNELGKGGELKV
jgi:adenylosuccinate lyase